MAILGTILYYTAIYFAIAIPLGIFIGKTIYKMKHDEAEIAKEKAEWKTESLN